MHFWVAGEGGVLPAEVIGPRTMTFLKGRAAILTKRLAIGDVAKDGGLQLIFDTLESSSLLPDLAGQRGERAQREFLRCRRSPGESIDSYLMRVEDQRDLKLEDNQDLTVGDKFLGSLRVDSSRSSYGHCSGKQCYEQCHDLPCPETHGPPSARNSADWAWDC